MKKLLFIIGAAFTFVGFVVLFGLDLQRSSDDLNLWVAFPVFMICQFIGLSLMIGVTSEWLDKRIPYPEGPRYKP